MTLFDFEELTAYWAEHPPLHILISAYLGVGKDRHRPVQMPPGNREHKTGSELEAVLAELGPGFGPGDVHAGLTPVVLDFTELRRRAGAGK
jgi:hypothetical protein